MTNSLIETCTLTVKCSNVPTVINFGYVLQFLTFETLFLRFNVSFPELPLQLSAVGRRRESKNLLKEGAGGGVPVD